MKTKILTALILLAVLNTACSRELGRCGLTEEQKKVIPYEKGQIISFIDGADQAVDLTVTEIKTEWYKETEGSFRDDYVSLGIKTAMLKSESNKLEIYLRLVANGCSYGNDYCSLEIRVTPTPNQGYFKFTSDAEGIFLTFGSPSFHDSIEINNKVYYDVAESKFYSTSHNVNVPEIPMQLFYNKTCGILQINRDGENFLTISN